MRAPKWRPSRNMVESPTSTPASPTSTMGVNVAVAQARNDAAGHEGDVFGQRDTRSTEHQGDEDGRIAAPPEHIDEVVEQIHQ